MKAALLIILLASICLLHAGAHIPHVPVDVKKIAGKWYLVAYVLKGKGPMNRIPFEDVVELSGGGDVVLKTRYVKDGKCQVTERKVVHTDQPGVFKIPVTSEVLHVVAVHYESYHITHVVENNAYSLYLSSRTREPSEDVKKAFRALAGTLGYDLKQIVYGRLAGKSSFGGMLEECATSIIHSMVLQMILTANCHIFRFPALEAWPLPNE